MAVLALLPDEIPHRKGEPHTLYEKGNMLADSKLTI